MSLVFAGHIPNDPQLIDDTIQHPLPKDQSSVVAAISEIEGELYFMKPETVIFLTEHQAPVAELVNMHITPQFQHALFTGSIIKTDALLTSEIKGAPETQQREIPLTVIAEATLEDRVAAPVGLLMRHLAQQTKVIILSIPPLSAEVLVQFGEFLKREIMRTDRRVALFSTGNISAHATIPSAMTLAHILHTSITEHRLDSIRSIQPQLITDAQCDAIRSLTVLCATLAKMNIAPEIFASDVLRNQHQLVLNCILQ